MLNAEPTSYWQHTSQEMVLSTDLPASADYVVIGGGYLGASTCYWLSQAGANVVLIEQTVPAHGATGRNGGFLSLGPAEAYLQAIQRLGHQTAREVLQVTLESRGLLRQVLAEEKIACDYRETGTLALALALDADQQHAFSQSHTALEADGVVTQLLDRQQVQELIGTPLGSEIVGGMLTPETALVHPARLVQGLITAAQRRGSHFVNATVLRLMHDENTVVVHTSHGAIRAKHVVVATNAWITDLLPHLAQVVVPVRGQVLSYAPLPPIFRTGMGVDMTGTGEYWQQTLDGSIVLGGCRALAPQQDVGVRVSQPTQEVQQALEQVFPRLFPSLSGLQVAQRWAGLMAFTPDYLPIADIVPDMKSVWVVGGFSGHGMPFGMRLGQLLAESLMRGAVANALLPFRLARPTLRV